MIKYIAAASAVAGAVVGAVVGVEIYGRQTVKKDAERLANGWDYILYGDRPAWLIRKETVGFGDAWDQFHKVNGSN